MSETECDGCWNHWKYKRERGPEPLTEEPSPDLLKWYALVNDKQPLPPKSQQPKE